MLRTSLVLSAMLVTLTATAHAEVDWAKGLVTAPGIGLADRQAPNPAVARGPSRRRGEDAARQALAAALPALPLASGGTLGDKLGDPKLKARIDAAVAAAIGVTAEPETDGSWRVTMAVPVEAVRMALAGSRALPAAGDTGTPVVIVEGVTAAPAVGYTVGGLAAATVWVKELPAWAKGAPHVTVKAGTPATAGAIEADVKGATVATLFVIVTKR